MISEKISKPVDLKNLQIEIIPNLSTGKCIMKNKLTVTFSNTLCHILGFEKTSYPPGEHLGETMIDISLVTDINIECDLIDGGYIILNNEMKSSNILYTFPANTVPFGYKIVERMNPPIYLPIINHVISNMHIRILDQNGKLISFNGEKISMLLHLKQV